MISLTAIRAFGSRIGRVGLSGFTCPTPWALSGGLSRTGPGRVVSGRSAGSTLSTTATLPSSAISGPRGPSCSNTA